MSTTDRRAIHPLTFPSVAHAECRAQEDPRFLRSIALAQERTQAYLRLKTRRRWLRRAVMTLVLLVAAAALVVAVPLLISLFAAHTLRSFEQF